MTKSHSDELREEVEALKNGRPACGEFDPPMVIRDPQNLQKRLNALRRLNGLPPRKIDWEKDYGMQPPVRSGKASVKRAAQQIQKKLACTSPLKRRQ